jgi:hypothetical protein
VPSETLRENLALAERKAADGERRVVRQQTLIDELERDCHPTQLAKELLTTLEQSQHELLAECDRLVRELALR